MDIKINHEDVIPGNIFHITNASGNKMVSTILEIKDDGTVVYTLIGCYIKSLKEVANKTVEGFVYSYNGPGIHVYNIIKPSSLTVGDDMFVL